MSSVVLAEMVVENFIGRQPRRRPPEPESFLIGIVECQFYGLGRYSFGQEGEYVGVLCTVSQLSKV